MRVLNIQRQQLHKEPVYREKVYTEPDAPHPSCSVSQHTVPHRSLHLPSASKRPGGRFILLTFCGLVVLEKGSKAGAVGMEAAMDPGVAKVDRRNQTDARGEGVDEERYTGDVPETYAAIPSEDNTSAALEAVKLPCFQAS